MFNVETHRPRWLATSKDRRGGILQEPIYAGPPAKFTRVSRGEDFLAMTRGALAPAVKQTLRHRRRPVHFLIVS